MKPIAIFRYAETEGPAYLADFLREAGRAHVEFRIDRGEQPPASAEAFAGMACMGGPMSVNDDLPWIAPMLALIRDAVARDVPVIGHCLGGQLISKALGGTVARNAPGKEIGWGELEVVDAALGREWFGSDASFMGFHWHGETFTVPQGARLVARSRHCANQAYVLGPHVGMQFHPEMDVATIDAWCCNGAEEIEAALAKAAAHPGVSTVRQIREQVGEKLPQMRAMSRHLYARWAKGWKG